MEFWSDTAKTADIHHFSSWTAPYACFNSSFAGVSIGSVARRLGHASMTTTQKTYLHIIQELENQDIDLVMRITG